LNTEFKKGFNWTIGAITGVALSAIMLFLAATMIAGCLKILVIMGDFL
jgi:hypothetical protein